MRTRSQASAALTLVSLPAALKLVSLPANAFQQVIAACSFTEDGVPLFDTVKGLGCVSKGMRQQLHQLRPLVGVQSLAVMQRPAHDPWRVSLLYEGWLTEAVLEQARQGRVRSISTTGFIGVPAVVRRAVPELLGEGCSLLELGVSRVQLFGTWAEIFGEAAVCSAVLRRLRLESCGLRGPLPELRLPALQELLLCDNQLTGSLEPLRGCTALQTLIAYSNLLTGGLEPLRGCTALRELRLGSNLLTSGLEPLEGCTALLVLDLFDNLLLTGSLKPLQGCTALQER